MNSPNLNPPAHDVLSVRGLRTVAVVGALAHERTQPQPLEVDIDVYGDFTRAAQTDDLVDAVDYASLADVAVDVCREAEAQLLERLADQVARAVLEAAGAGAAGVSVAGATVTVTKLRPPVPHDLARASVTVTRWVP